MAERAAAGEEGVEASAIELEREGPSYTYLTLEALADRDADREVFLLLGADVAAGLASWKEPERVVELAQTRSRAAARSRAGAVRSALERLGAADRAEIIEMPLCGVSSTMIRQRVAAARPLRHLVPDPVAELIADRGLYR